MTTDRHFNQPMEFPTYINDRSVGARSGNRTDRIPTRHVIDLADGLIVRSRTTRKYEHHTRTGLSGGVHLNRYNQSRNTLRTARQPTRLKWIGFALR